MDVKERMKDVEARNLKTTETISSLVKQRAELDKQIAALREETISQGGEYKALQALLDPPKSEPVDPKSETVN